MALLELKKGVVIQLDEADVDLVFGLNWAVHKVKNISYAVYRFSENGKTNHVLMHRHIMQPKIDEVVDHIDGNGLNNRRSNLRVCRQFQNTWNKKNNNQTGVSFKKNKGYWQALIGYKGQRLTCGCYKTKEEAQKARNYAAYMLWGSFSNITPDDFAGFNPKRLPETVRQFIAAKLHQNFVTGAEP